MFKAGKYEFPLGKRTYVMGILNVTKDSFADGGKYNTPESYIDKILNNKTEYYKITRNIIILILMIMMKFMT